MVDNVIQIVTEKLSSLPCIEGIVLGGSRARGTHTEDSDIDWHEHRKFYGMLFICHIMKPINQR